MNGLGRITTTLFLLMTILLLLKLEVPIHACCDADPKSEIFAQSPNRKYAALITPRYYVRSIRDFTLDIYQDNAVLTSFQQRSTKTNYKSVWQTNFYEPGSDFINLVVTDNGHVLVILDSYTFSPDSNALQLYNPKGENVLSYPKSILLSYLEVPGNLNLSDLSANPSHNRIDFHYEDNFLFGINCEDGEIITGQSP